MSQDSSKSSSDANHYSQLSGIDSPRNNGGTCFPCCCCCQFLVIVGLIAGGASAIHYGENNLTKGIGGALIVFGILLLAYSVCKPSPSSIKSSAVQFDDNEMNAASVKTPTPST